MTIDAIHIYNETISTEIRFKFKPIDKFEPLMNLELTPLSNTNFVVNNSFHLRLNLYNIIKECSIYPELPDGLIFQSFAITGKPTTVDYKSKEYQIQCKNDMSISSNITFSSAVLPNSKKGSLLANYFILNNGGAFNCEIKYDPNIFKNLTSIHRVVEEKIQHPPTPEGKWENYHPRLENNWGVSMSGFINIPVTEIYYFKIKSTNGAWMEIDGVAAADSPGCRNFNDDTKTYPTSLTQGRHAVRILFNNKVGDPAMSLIWKVGIYPDVEIPDYLFEYGKEIYNLS